MQYNRVTAAASAGLAEAVLERVAAILSF